MFNLYAKNIDTSVFTRYFGIFGILNTDVGIGIGIPIHPFRSDHPAHMVYLFYSRLRKFGENGGRHK